MSLSPETEEVLRRARLSTAMAPEQRRRLKSRIVARIAATGTLLVASDAAARGGFALWSWTLGTTAKSVTALALVASLGAGGYVATRAVQRSRAQIAPSAHHEPEPSRRAEPAAPPAMPEPRRVPLSLRRRSRCTGQTFTANRNARNSCCRCRCAQHAPRRNQAAPRCGSRLTRGQYRSGHDLARRARRAIPQEPVCTRARCRANGGPLSERQGRHRGRPTLSHQPSQFPAGRAHQAGVPHRDALTPPSLRTTAGGQ